MRSARPQALELLTPPDTVSYVGQLARTALASALARLTFMGTIERSHAAALIATFLAHERRDYRLVPLAEGIQREAERLLFAHGIRTVDAIHVASALQVGRTVAAHRTEFQFVTADGAAQDGGVSVAFVA